MAFRTDEDGDLGGAGEGGHRMVGAEKPKSQDPPAGAPGGEDGIAPEASISTLKNSVGTRFSGKAAKLFST
ncbi:MAG: hypothetical protein PHN90_07765 [Methanothrix sp.]|nr:hypothetical protein [Methanothrix sp.]HOI68869.1 hypothetical protein [Methanothrix sp.]